MKSQFSEINIVGVGVAFSPTLKANVNEAVRMAVFLKAKLVCIHVGEHTPEKEKTVNTLISECDYAFSSFKLIFSPGDPVKEILSQIKIQQIQLLILGALQKENIYRFYVGSIARKITRKASCSVLLLIKPSIKRVPCRHIVANGLEDPCTVKTIQHAFWFAHCLHSERLTVVEEIKPKEVAIPVEDDRSLRKATLLKKKLRIRENKRVQKIIDAIPTDYKKGLAIKTQSIFGKRGYSIGHYAEVVRADLLVMNPPHKTGVLDRVFPHDIEHILSDLPTDVLIVR